MTSSAIISVLVAIPSFTASVWTALLVFSLLFPDLRVWPVPLPARRAVALRTAIYRSTGLATGLSAACLLVLAVIDFDSLQLPRFLHLSLGGLLFLAGGALAGTGFLTLGPEISTGAPPGAIQLRGPYRISRNPQYVGTIAVLLGVGLLANSTLAILASVGWCIWFLVAPFAEETFLRNSLGPVYEAYLASTRRYL